VAEIALSSLYLSVAVLIDIVLLLGFMAISIYTIVVGKKLMNTLNNMKLNSKIARFVTSIIIGSAITNILLFILLLLLVVASSNTKTLVHSPALLFFYWLLNSVRDLLIILVFQSPNKNRSCCGLINKRATQKTSSLSLSESDVKLEEGDSSQSRMHRGDSIPAPDTAVAPNPSPPVSTMTPAVGVKVNSAAIDPPRNSSRKKKRNPTPTTSSTDKTTTTYATSSTSSSTSSS